MKASSNSCLEHGDTSIPIHISSQPSRFKSVHVSIVAERGGIEPHAHGTICFQGSPGTPVRFPFHGGERSNRSPCPFGHQSASDGCRYACPIHSPWSARSFTSLRSARSCTAEGGVVETHALSSTTRFRGGPGAPVRFTLHVSANDDIGTTVPILVRSRLTDLTRRLDRHDHSGGRRWSRTTSGRNRTIPLAAGARATPGSPSMSLRFGPASVPWGHRFRLGPKW